MSIAMKSISRSPVWNTPWTLRSRGCRTPAARGARSAARAVVARVQQSAERREVSGRNARRFARPREDGARTAPLETDLKELLASWFDLGFLDMRRISWDAPASLLEKLGHYEAVHEVRGWLDLKTGSTPTAAVCVHASRNAR